jgi:hypothetical protein
LRAGTKREGKPMREKKGVTGAYGMKKTKTRRRDKGKKNGHRIKSSYNS